VPDYTTQYRFLKRLDEGTIHEALGEAVRQLQGVRRRRQRRTRVAVDATGLAQGARQHLLRAAPAPPHAAAPAVAALVESDTLGAMICVTHAKPGPGHLLCAQAMFQPPRGRFPLS